MAAEAPAYDLGKQGGQVCVRVRGVAGSCQCPFALPLVQMLLLAPVGKRRTWSLRSVFSAPVSSPEEGGWRCSRGGDSRRAQRASDSSALRPEKSRHAVHSWRGKWGSGLLLMEWRMGKWGPQAASGSWGPARVKGGPGQSWQLLAVLSSHLGCLWASALLAAPLGGWGAISEPASWNLWPPLRSLCFIPQNQNFTRLWRERLSLEKGFSLPNARTLNKKETASGE